MGASSRGPEMLTFHQVGLACIGDYRSVRDDLKPLHISQPSQPNPCPFAQTTAEKRLLQHAQTEQKSMNPRSLEELANSLR